MTVGLLVACTGGVLGGRAAQSSAAAIRQDTGSAAGAIGQTLGEPTVTASRVGALAATLCRTRGQRFWWCEDQERSSEC